MRSILKEDGFIKSTFGSIRKIVAISLTGVFCYLSVTGKVTTDQFLPVFSMVIGYYFGKSTALDVPGNTQGNEVVGNKEDIANNQDTENK